jgi:hypothetical protein
MTRSEEIDVLGVARREHPSPQSPAEPERQRGERMDGFTHRGLVARHNPHRRLLRQSARRFRGVEIRGQLVFLAVGRKLQ